MFQYFQKKFIVINTFQYSKERGADLVLGHLQHLKLWRRTDFYLTLSELFFQFDDANELLNG